MVEHPQLRGGGVSEGIANDPVTALAESENFAAYLKNQVADLNAACQEHARQEKRLRKSLKAIWEQTTEGLVAQHDCPAVFALAAILAELTDLGYCANCFMRAEPCRHANKQQRKCCPDCTHVK